MAWLKQTRPRTIWIVSAAAGLSAAASFAARSFWQSRKSEPQHAHNKDNPAKPMFYPVQTSHTRLHPQVHSLSYPFMWTGIPIGFRGNIGGILSVDHKMQGTSAAWYTINACDYMKRSNKSHGLQDKVQQFLVSQNANPKDYPHAYLLTVSKFLGHAFNPVSFWYLYSTDRTLSAVILEVNNTFGERHLYFLTCTPNSASYQTDTPTRFRFRSFQKDFFVSPFSDRSGSYSLLTNDPLHPNMAGAEPINITLTLSSDAGRPKVVARVYSNGTPVDPTTMGWWQVRWFALSRAWDTWATEPRTVYQAALLMFKRGLAIFTVPEPLSTTICRRAKDHEIVIEAVFRKYFIHLISNSETAVLGRYKSAGIPDASAERTLSPSAKLLKGKEIPMELMLKALTPEFYARLVRYRDLREALIEEGGQEQTVDLEDHDGVLEELMDGCPMPEAKLSWIDIVAMKVFWLLRRSPPSLDPLDIAVKANGIRDPDDNIGEIVSEVREGGKRNDLDSFVFAFCDKDEQRRYKKAVLKLLLSDWLALGKVDLLALQRLVIRIGLVWMVGEEIRNVLHHSLMRLIES